MFCTNCGAELLPNANFCTKCGAKTENSTTPMKSCSSIQSFHNFRPHPDVFPLLWFADGQYRNIDVKQEALQESYSTDCFNVKIYGAPEPSALYSNMEIRKPIGEVPRPPYYPTYKDLTPEQKYKYLEFLADPYGEHDISYVFIFYYGLERQLISGHFDSAFDVILKLRDKYSNKSFQQYSANALALTSVLLNKQDKFVDFIASLDKDYELSMSANLYILLKYTMKEPLTAIELMRFSSDFGFTNKRYIKNNSELFEKCLHEVMLESQGFDGLEIPKSRLSSFDTPVFANVSLIKTTINAPNFFSSKELIGKGYMLLNMAHSKCKEVLAEQRKTKSTKS